MELPAKSGDAFEESLFVLFILVKCMASPQLIQYHKVEKEPQV